MSSLKSGVVLPEGETLVLEIESGLVSTSSFLILRFLIGILRFLGQLVGIRTKGFIVLTNKRVIEVYNQFVFWGWKVRKTVKNVPLKYIKEVNYNKKGVFLCFYRAYHLYYERSLQRVYAILKGLSEAELQKAVNLFFTTVLKST
ncbi:MAG: hypothetical protein LBV52_05290 [Spirochaetaceae bacterium]|jgi:hypothetical protein|nr:hypothetical protein [Spirochaetaceae bacterium]